MAEHKLVSTTVKEFETFTLEENQSVLEEFISEGAPPTAEITYEKGKDFLARTTVIVTASWWPEDKE